MLIGIMSDSHDNINAIQKAIKIFKERQVEKILHLGDIVAPFTIKYFKDVGNKLIGIFGNNDGDKFTLMDVFGKYEAKLSEAPLELEIDSKKIIMIHGYRSPDTTKFFVESLAHMKKYDIILYGHTHVLDNRVIDKTRIINPGETCGYLTAKRTVVLYNTKTDSVELIQF